MANILYDALFGKHANRDTPFLWLEDGTKVTHASFLNLTAQFAYVLTDAGLSVGDRVAVQIEKSGASLAIYAACVQAGFVFLPLNTAYTTDEVQYFVQNSGAKFLVCDPAKADALRNVVDQAGAQLETLDVSGIGSLAAIAEAKDTTFVTVDRSGDDLAAFLYTSGTTGRSKGAMLSHQNLLSNSKVLADLWQFTSDDVLLHALPIFHTHGLFVASNITLLAGGSMIFLPKFDLEVVIKKLPQATSIMGVPTFYTRLLSDVQFNKDLTAHMRLFISGSAPLLAETHVEFEKRTGHRILERYGMTETNMNTSNPYDGERRAGTVGFPLPGVELKVTNPTTGETLPNGEIGILEVRGDNVFQGYWQMPKKTSEELRKDGFFITGDIGVIDADGYVQIVGRNKDLIISGGFNIYPKEIEEVIDAQDGVLESAVVGVPHPDFGETPVGILVAKAGTTPNLNAISIHLNDTLARFKHPRKLILVEALPRNTMGKVQKNLLRDEFKNLFS